MSWWDVVASLSIRSLEREVRQHILWLLSEQARLGKAGRFNEREASLVPPSGM